MILKFATPIIVIFTTGCTTTAPIPTTTKIVEKPPINTNQTEELGNTLIEYFISSSQASIRVLEQWGISSKKKNLAPQTLRPIGTGERVSLFYIDETPPDTPNVFKKVCYDPADSIFFIPNGFGACDSIGKAVLNSGPVKVAPEDYIDIRLPQFRQELIYNGKVGNNVKFLYRELTSGYMRAPFTQEIQYDLSEGSVIGFKGARLEIISSTNRSIEYRVLNSFKK
ncbi:hypothetical protein [Hydrogenophaga palleronii]|uniref:hypothetical protein n=1 Tax=Hydrogenophaga palleronii TaxID=65655 RepID=UPI000AABCCAE|nr:hypothetical protein [Hydrogenophaga palleronii]